MATIREIAEKANVSVSTVSLALNGKPRVSSETKKRIMSTVMKLGYQKNGNKQLGHATKVWNIGIVYPKRVVIDGAITSLCREWIGGIRESLAGRVGNLTVFGGSENVEQDVMFHSVIEDGELNGVILIGVTPEDGYLEKLSSLSLPTVLFNRRLAGNKFSTIGIDNYSSGQIVSNFLSKLGHKKVAFIYGDESMEFNRERKNGAIEAFAEKGMHVFTGSVGLSSSDSDHEKICRDVIDSGSTAAYITGDSNAVRCIDLWEKMGVDIPKELSVVGFNDLGIKSKSGLCCTSVGFDKFAMGKSAGQVLLQLLEQDFDICNMSITFNTRIIQHDTTSIAYNRS